MRIWLLFLMISRFLQLNASVQYTIIPFYLKHGTQHKELVWARTQTFWSGIRRINHQGSAGMYRNVFVLNRYPEVKLMLKEKLTLRTDCRGKFTTAGQYFLAFHDESGKQVLWWSRESRDWNCDPLVSAWNICHYYFLIAGMKGVVQNLVHVLNLLFRTPTISKWGLCKCQVNWR